MTRHQTGCYPAICSVTSMNVDWRSFLALGRSFALILCVFLYHLQQNITKKWFMQMPHPYPANWSCHQWSHRMLSQLRGLLTIFTMSQVCNLHKGGPEWHKCAFYMSMSLYVKWTLCGCVITTLSETINNRNHIFRSVEIHILTTSTISNLTSSYKKNTMHCVVIWAKLPGIFPPGS